MVKNIDTIYFSVLVDDYSNAIEKYVEELDGLKALASRNKSECISDIVTITIGNMTFKVNSTGSMGYAYILNNDYYQVKLAKWESNNKYFYPIFIEIRQAPLWNCSFIEAKQTICDWIEANFGTIITDKISRVDLCCHIDTIDFSNNIAFDSFKGRYRTTIDTLKSHTQYRELNCLTFGKRDSRIYCRIYNKSLEVVQKCKLWFKDIWIENGMNPEKVWNIEFELKRDFMKSYGLETVDDFFAHINEIWRYLTSNWLILTDNNRTRIENATIHTSWLEVQKAFDDFESIPLTKREKQINSDVEVLIPALSGYVSSISANKNIFSIDEALECVKSNMLDYYDRKGTTFEDVVSDKNSIIMGV